MHKGAWIAAIIGLAAFGLAATNASAQRHVPPNLGNNVMPVQTPAYYSFYVQSFNISDTMALHEDTDYATLTVTMTGHDPITQLESEGNVNNGVHQTNLVGHLNVPADANVQVTVNYLIVNRGHADDRFENALLHALGNSAQLGSYLLADCDGVVARGSRTYTGQQLSQQTAGNHVITWTDGFSGSPPHRLCHHSSYNVTLGIRQNFTATGPSPARQ